MVRTVSNDRYGLNGLGNAEAGSTLEVAMTLTIGRQGEATTGSRLAERALFQGGTMMGGSLLGLEHLYAQARQQDFVREAERLEAVQVAESRQVRDGGTRVDRVRRVAGGLLILLGERVRGARPGESVTAPAAGFRLAR